MEPRPLRPRGSIIPAVPDQQPLPLPCYRRPIRYSFGGSAPNKYRTK